MEDCVVGKGLMLGVVSENYRSGPKEQLEWACKRSLLASHTWGRSRIWYRKYLKICSCGKKSLNAAVCGTRHFEYFWSHFLDTFTFILSSIFWDHFCPVSLSVWSSFPPLRSIGPSVVRVTFRAQSESKKDIVLSFFNIPKT